MQMLYAWTRDGLSIQCEWDNYFEEPLRIHGCDAMLVFVKGTRAFLLKLIFPKYRLSNQGKDLANYLGDK